MKTVKILILAIILIISGSLSYSILQKMSSENEEIEEGEEEVASSENLEEDESIVNLSMDLNNVTYVNETGQILLKINSGILEIPSFDLILTYDPEVIEIESIENGDFTEYLLKEINAEKGMITISAISNAESLFRGEGTLAKLNFKSLHESTVKVDYVVEGDESTYIALVGGESKANLNVENLSVSIIEKPEETTAETTDSPREN